MIPREKPEALPVFSLWWSNLARYRIVILADESTSLPLSGQVAAVDAARHHSAAEAWRSWRRSISDYTHVLGSGPSSHICEARRYQTAASAELIAASQLLIFYIFMFQILLKTKKVENLYFQNVSSPEANKNSLIFCSRLYVSEFIRIVYKPLSYCLKV